MKTRRNHKRLLCMLLILVMVLTIIPAMSVTAFAGNNDYFQIFINGSATASGTYGSGNEMYTWNSDTRTLTLDNYHGRPFLIVNEWNEIVNEVTVHLLGRNVVTMNNCQFGIRIKNKVGKLNFTGAGNLEVNSLTNQSHRCAIDLHEVGSFPGQIIFSGSGIIEINMEQTQNDTITGINISSGSSKDNSLIKIEENAKVNINMRSSVNGNIWGFYTMGRAEVYGTLNITGTDTSGDTGISHSGWDAAFVTSLQSIIGTNAHIKVNFPTGAYHGGFKEFKLAANDNIALEDSDWGACDSDYDGKVDALVYAKPGVYVKLSDSNGATSTAPTYADYLYDTNLATISTSLTITAPVVGQAPSDALSYSNGINNASLALGKVKWKVILSDGVEGDFHGNFKDGRKYRAKIPVTAVVPAIITEAKVNGVDVTDKYDWGTQSYIVDFDPLVSNLTFTDSTTFDIPEGIVDTYFTFHVSGAVSGGTAPYTYGGDNTPSWLHVVRDTGDVYGTRPSSVTEATTAVISVEDAENTKRTITINVGEVRQPIVTFVLNGKGTNFTQSVTKNQAAIKPADPTATDYTFWCWNYQNQPFDFSTIIREDITLKADWLYATAPTDMENVTAVINQAVTVSLEKVKNPGLLPMTLEEKVNGKWEWKETLNYPGYTCTDFTLSRQSSKVTKTYRVVIDDKLYGNEFTVSWTDSGEPLTFTGPVYDIPEGTIGYVSSGFNLNINNDSVKGGVSPYSFGKLSGPDWVKISPNGYVSGTRPMEPAPATTAVALLSDSAGTTIEIPFNVGAVINTLRVPALIPDDGKTFLSKMDVFFNNLDFTASTYYTKDGSDPKTSSTRQLVTDTNIVIDDTCTIKVYSKKDGFPDTPVVSATYTKITTPHPPTATPAGGTVPSGTNVELNRPTSNTYMRYFMTTDGTEPATPTGTFGTEYKISTRPTITGSAGTIVKIKAVAYSSSDDSIISPVASFTYTIASTGVTLAEYGSNLKLTVVNAVALAEDDHVMIARYDNGGKMVEAKDYTISTLTASGSDRTKIINKPGTKGKLKVFLLKKNTYAPVCSAVQWCAVQR